MARLTLVAILAALLCSNLVMAQVARPGKWTPRRLTEQMQRDLRESRFVLPLQDNNNLLKNEDTVNGGYQFGNPVDVRITLDNSGRVFTVQGGRVWILEIFSEGALNLNLIFDKFYLPEGAELYAYNDETVRGAFTSHNNKQHGWFSIAPLSGSSMYLELFVPFGVTSEPVISISKVTHGYKSLAFGSSGSCNVNVVCSQGDAWRAQIRGAAMMLTAFGSRYCSGSMISNVNQDGRQLFLTAYHCTGGNMYSDQLMFNYESSICERVAQRDGPTDQTVSGLLSLASYAQSDFAIFEVEEDIPDSYNVYLNGFSADNIAPTAMVGIHHPSGDIKKISFANKTGEPYKWSNAEPGFYHWEVPFWDEGTTEPGSSGSPLFNQNKRIIGQLHGGGAACGNRLYDAYGALWASWDKGTQKLQPILDPSGTGRRYVDGISLSDARRKSKTPK